MGADLFDDMPDAYDAMIDWPKRLAREEPFYRWLFERVRAASVLDVACGTGHHAAMFHSWGLRVEGADLSEAMIQRCRLQYGQPQALRWVVRSFDEPAGTAGAFDVAVCAGNSLALAADMAAMQRAVARMLEAVRPGGAIVVQVLNLWRMADGPCTWQKCRRADLARGDSLIIKGVHRCGRRGYVDMVVVSPGAGEPAMQGESVPFWGVEPADLEHMIYAGGAATVEIFGGYDRQVYRADRSQDVLAVGIKGQAG